MPPGGLRSFIGTFGSNAPRGRFGTLPFDPYNRQIPGPAGPAPLSSDTKDMGAYIVAAAAGTKDLGASLTPVGGVKALMASISGTSSTTYDLSAFLTPIETVISDIRGILTPLIHAQTEPLTYEEIIVGTPLGFSIIHRLLTNFPDITASIQGYALYDLAATIRIRQREYSDLQAIISVLAPETRDLPATLIATLLLDMTGSIFSIVPEDIPASIESIPYFSLPTSVTPIPPKDLGATGGGHLPEDIPTSLFVNLPKDLITWIRAGESDVSDVSATLTATGSYTELPTSLQIFVQVQELFPASIGVLIPSNIRAFITGLGQLDISASITGVFSDLINAIVIPVIKSTSNMLAFTRAAYASSEDMEVFIHGFISAHTTNKPINFPYLKRPFRTLMIAQRRGLTLLQIEPIRGIFPDLGASLTPTPLNRLDMLAFIRPVSSSFLDISSSIASVTKTIYINKIVLNFDNLKDLSAILTAYSGYRNVPASIRGVASTSTTTAPGSGFVRVSSTIRFFLGTDSGLYIPQRVVGQIRVDRFINTSNLPDLHAYVFGWDVKGISASITVQPYFYLGGIIFGLGIDTLKNLSATLFPAHYDDMSASLSPTGYFNDLESYVTAVGVVSSISASINPYIKVLGYRVVAVHTKPFLDLRATINTGIQYLCTFSSGYSPLAGYIRGFETGIEGSGDIVASILSNRDSLDMSSSIVGKKISRIKILNIGFRTLVRDSKALLALVVGVGNGYSDMSASISGKPHEVDISATISAFRHPFAFIEKTPLIDVYSISRGVGSLYKRISLSFTSKVEKYIFDSVDNAIYPIGDGRWALNLSELTVTEDFFDRDTNDRRYTLDDVTLYDSVDEAIRAAIEILTEGSRYDMMASITATGGYLDILSSISTIRKDKVKDLPSKLMIVSSLPDISASISAFSGYRAMAAFVKPVSSGIPDLYASLIGVTYTSLGANITGVV